MAGLKELKRIRATILPTNHNDYELSVDNMVVGYGSSLELLFNRLLYTAIGADARELHIDMTIKND